MSGPISNSESCVKVPIWRETWPQRLEVWWFASALFLGFCAGVGFAFAWSGDAGSVAGSIGLAGGGAMFLGLSWGVFRRAGFRWVRASKRVSVCRSEVYGTGIRVGPGVMAANLLIAVLLGNAAYFVSVLLVWRWGYDSLLPDSRVGVHHYVISAVVAVVTIALVLLFCMPRTFLGVELYQEVVVRAARRTLFVRTAGDIVLPWTSIEEIVDEIKVVYHKVGSTNEPLIRLMTRDTVPTEGRFRWDTDDYVELPVSALAVEPNILLSVLREMHQSEARRRELLSLSPKTLFSPPQLRKRLWGPRE